MDQRWQAFLFGTVGGFATNVLRWYLIANSDMEERPVLDAFYWSQFVALGVFGGVLALGHDLVKEINPLVALNIGLSVPALAKTFAGEAQTPKSKRRTRKTP